MTNTDPRIAISLEDLAPWDDLGLENDEQSNYEQLNDAANSRELSLYGLDSDNQTLVGLGPVQRARRSRTELEVPESQRVPLSESPGPFIADDDEQVVRSLRGRKLGPWAIPLVGSLAIAAAAAVAVFRGTAPAAAPAKETVAAAVSVPATAGLEVKLNGAVAHVLVDGEDRGPSPISLQGLKPGSHVVSIADPAYAVYSQPVLLSEGRVTSIEPVLTFVRGVLRLNAGEGADDAEVEVVGANERREIQHLPARLEVQPGEYRIRATRKGYAPFESNAVLSSSNPEQQVDVSLARQSAGTASAFSSTLPAPAAGTDSSDSSAIADGLGALNVTSSQPANVVLDGRPLGKAPRVVRVPPGPHTVVFVNPSYGRRSLSVNVRAGVTSAASASF